MFASVQASPLMSAVAALAPALDDGGDSSLWSALAGVLMLGGVLWLFARLVQSDPEPPRSRRRAKSQPAAHKQPAARSTTRNVARIPRRVIPLHAVTPGQSRHEYNVGDEWGTRGTALVRVA